MSAGTGKLGIGRRESQCPSSRSIRTSWLFTSSTSVVKPAIRWSMVLCIFVTAPVNWVKSAVSISTCPVSASWRSVSRVNLSSIVISYSPPPQVLRPCRHSNTDADLPRARGRLIHFAFHSRTTFTKIPSGSSPSSRCTTPPFTYPSITCRGCFGPLPAACPGRAGGFSYAFARTSPVLFPVP